MNELTKTGWYLELEEDCLDIVTEYVFTSRWSLVEGYHALGKRLLEDDNFTANGKGNKTLVQGLARNLHMSDRTLYYAMQFFESYPDLDKVPFGKNLSWNKVIRELLTKSREAKECIHTPVVVCKQCHRVLEGYYAEKRF